ncbi:ABC transporter substrate-binding protein [Nonomuraea longicatena]|uniref:Iron-siderophore ABC transporter substrate-binding protein n=1 Tax=Nonomuraea longicatena TaxID=83682 RepID=A0ABP3ZPG6_9ACTN
MTRRDALRLAGIGGLSLALTGCGSAGEAPAASAGGSFPVTLEGAQGSAVLNAAPARIVSVGLYRDIDAAVALGLVPLATPDLSGFMEGGISPWVSRELPGAKPELLAVTDGLPFEKIAALAPDLILATDHSGLAENYAALSRIAPTLSTASGYNRDPWQVTTTRVGTALGVKSRAETLVSQVEGAILAAKAANPGFAGRTFTIGPVTAEGVINTVNSPTDASALFMSQLGLTLSPKVADLPKGNFPGRATVSPELIEAIDADVVILTFNTPQARSRLEANELFRRIPAVRRGSYIALDLPTAIAMAFPSALSIPYGLERSVPRIAAALKA